MELNLDWRREQSATWPAVSFELRPLRVWAFQELLSFWEEQQAADGAPGAVGGAVGAVRGARLMAVAAQIFPEHVRGVAGLTVWSEGESRPVTPELLCAETPLMGLAGEIVARLMAISEFDPAAEKN